MARFGITRETIVPLVAVGVLQALVGLAATKALSASMEIDLARDIGIVVVWVSLIGAGLYLMVRTRHFAAVTMGAPQARRSSPAWSPPASMAGDALRSECERLCADLRAFAQERQNAVPPPEPMPDPDSPDFGAAALRNSDITIGHWRRTAAAYDERFAPRVLWVVDELIRRGHVDASERARYEEIRGDRDIGPIAREITVASYKL